MVFHIAPVIEIDIRRQNVTNRLEMRQKFLNSQHRNLIIRTDGWT